MLIKGNKWINDNNNNNDNYNNNNNVKECLEYDDRNNKVEDHTRN